jgi:multiple sugar transport system permease protein
VVAAARPSRRARPALSAALDRPAVMGAAVGLCLGFLLLFVAYPIAYNVLLSLQDVTLGNIGRSDRPFVGLRNYAEVVGDPAFLTIARNTAVFVAGNVLLSFVLGLLLALFFDLGFPGAGWLRGLFLAAWVLPPMVIGALFKWILATEYGVLNEALLALGVVTERIYWLSDPGRALLGVTLANVWYGTPFVMVLLAAGLATIPQDLYEAAAIDGADRRRRFAFVTAPLLMPAAIAVLTLSTIYTLRVFDLIWTMTRGGPVDSTSIMPLWSYLFSFELFMLGHGAAVATLTLGLVVGVALLYVRSLRGEHRL